MLKDWRLLMSTNLHGEFRGTKHALAAMRDSDPVNGLIITISSILGLVGMPDIAAYNDPKGGVLLYSKSVALSCAERRLNVRVSTIDPGFIDTPPLLRMAMGRFTDPKEGYRFYDVVKNRAPRNTRRHCFWGFTPSFGRIEIRHRPRTGGRWWPHGTLTSSAAQT